MNTKYLKGLVKTDKDAGTFSVIASTATVDRQGEIIDQNGWDLTNYKNNPIILWAHDYSALPIGVAENISVEDGELRMSGRFASAEANPMAEQVRQLYADGILKTVSVGFIPLERNGNTITKSELLEVSFVPVPANPQALSLAMTKGLQIEKTLVELIEKCSDHDATEPEVKEEEPEEEKGEGEIQSVSISKENFGTVEEATQYVADKGWSTDDVSETETAWIFTQFDAELCEADTLQTVGLTAGISTNVCTTSDGKGCAVCGAKSVEVKEGRVLSGKTRSLISSSIESMKASIASLEEMLSASEPQKAGEDTASIPDVNWVEDKKGVAEISEETLKALLVQTREAKQKSDLANAVLKKLLQK